jgi:RES domain-containing protein
VAGLRAHGVEQRDLACAWKQLAETGAPVPSWRVAERLRADGNVGIIVRSFAQGAEAEAKNLVLWRWGPALPHRVTVFDPDRRLPRGAASWRR